MEWGQCVALRVAGVSASRQSGLTFFIGVGADFQASHHEIHQPLPSLEIHWWSSCGGRDEAQPGNLVSFGAVEARRKGQKRMESGQSGRAPENPDNPYETLAPGGALGCRDDGARDRT